MFIRTFRLLQAFDHWILDFACQNNMGFINPQAVAVSHVADHPAVVGCGTEGVPSGTHDKFLGQVTVAVILFFTDSCETYRPITHCYPGHARDRQKLKSHRLSPFLTLAGC
jgi:hypothetical protein